MMRKASSSFLVFVFSFLALELLVHWHPSLRTTWEFLPSERGGDTNEFVTLWVDLFSRAVRARPFRETLYLLNLRPTLGDSYSSHPGLLTFLASLTQSIFGETPMVLRSLAIFFFSLRLSLLHLLTLRWLGSLAAVSAVAIYLAIPATQTYTHALSFEVVSGTFVLAAFALLPHSQLAGAAGMALAVASDYTAALACLTRRRALWVGAVGAFLFCLGWASLAAPSGAPQANLLRARDYLVGPFFVLTTNSQARAQLFHRLLECFPLFALLPALFELRVFGLRSRPDWWRACALGGLVLLLGFLGVFRAHAYLSSLLAIPLSVSAARGWLLLGKNKKLGGALALLAMAEVALQFEFPLKTRAAAEGRAVFAEEVRQLEPLLAGKTFNVKQEESLLRPKPLENLLTGARFTWESCAEYTVVLDSLPENCGQVLFRGRILRLESCGCGKAR